MLAEADDDAGQKKNNKRDALRTTQAVPFSMFDPIVAFEALNSNWINVPEVAKLGIQAAHKKIGLAREERLELQRALENLQKQFRGMQEHHVQQMNAQTSRVEQKPAAAELINHPRNLCHPLCWLATLTLCHHHGNDPSHPEAKVWG
eukprot:s300_g3.t1